MFSHRERERERVAEIRQGDQRNRAKGRIKTLREKKNGGEIGTRKATQLHPQRSLSLSLSISFSSIYSGLGNWNHVSNFHFSGFDFVCSGEKVFEWDQTLEEVNMYINLPPNVHSKQFYCKIQSKHLELGIKGNPPYLNVCFWISKFFFFVFVLIAVYGFVGFVNFANVFELLVLVFFSARARISR